MKRHLKRLMLVLSLFTTCSIHAQDESTALQFFDRLDSILIDPLPELSQVLPHYTRPEKEHTGLIVGTLNNVSDDKVNWGLVFAEMFRINLYSLPKYPIDIGNLNPFMLLYDARSIYFQSGQTVDLSRIENLETIANRYNIHNTLSGSVEKLNHAFNVTLKIKDLKSRKISERIFSFNQQDLRANLGKMLEWIYRHLGGISETDLLRIRQIGPDDLELIGEFAPILEGFYLDENATIPDEFLEKLSQESNFPTAHFFQIMSQKAGSSLHEHNEQVAIIANRYPDFQAIQSIAAQSFWHLDQAGLLQTKIAELKNSVASSPVEYSGFLELAQSLSDFGTPLQAVAIAKEGVLRWPGRHRSWMMFSFTVEQLAWHYRGGNFWRDVPEKGKQVFGKLIDFSKDAIDVAIKLHPTSGRAYGNRITLHHGYNEEMYQDFLKAIQYDPLRIYIYMDALNFSAKKWGGSLETQKRIYQIAERYLSKIELEQLWYKHIEPNQTSSANLLNRITASLGLPDNYFRNFLFEIQLADNKKYIYWFGILGLFLLSTFFIRQSRQRKDQQALVLKKTRELYDKVCLLKKKLKLENKHLIIEQQDNAIVLPQIEQFYYVSFTSEGLKIDSHFGKLNGNIEQASSTMIEVINAGIQRHFNPRGL